MNEWLKKLIPQLKELWSKWTTIQKLILAGVIVVVIITLALVSRISIQPTDVPLFNVPIVDEATRDRIIYRLAQENVTATVNGAGIISVPNDPVARRMRSILVREDLVPGNVDPWALFDVDRWTTTDFERNINLRRSITDVVTRHIEALDDVDRANVVVTFPDKALFAADQNPVTASVIIYQKPGSDITTDRKKIQGIQKLLKFAVEGLKDENITIADSNGTVLNDFEGMQNIERVDVIAREQKLIAGLEAQYRAKILSALQSTFTTDRVRDLNIKIDMDMSKQIIEATEYNPIIIKPDNPDTPYDDSEIVESITLSHETGTKSWQGTGYNPEGPAGAEGQTPPSYADMSNVYGKHEESVVKENKAVNVRQIRSEKTPSIDRVSVSVNIDGTWLKKYDEKGNPIWETNGTIEREYVPLDADVIEGVTRQIQDAVGFNRSRGDSVSVQNIRFDRTFQFYEDDMKLRQQKQNRDNIVAVLITIMALLVVFVLFKVIGRELDRRKRIKEEQILRKHQLEREKSLWDAEQGGMEVSLSVDERKRLELQESAMALARENPEDTATLLKTWLMEE
ncbi:MAG: flagellar basal-body MS-ring/collar protein FliF [Treponemataceae bacterium]